MVYHCFSISITTFIFINIMENRLNSCVFSNIVERQKTDIFSICVFNDLTQLGGIFGPLSSRDPPDRGTINHLVFCDIEFRKIFAHHR